MSSAKIDYRELVPTDVSPSMVEDINRLLPQLRPSAQTVTEGWLHTMFSSGTRLFAALHEGRIVATVLLVPVVILVERKDWVEDVVVDKAYRRLGIADKLMDMAEEASRQGAASTIGLTTNQSREEALKMYLGRGYEFRKTGVYRKVL